MDQPKIAGKAPIVEKASPGTYFWCSCGLSSKQPFCDGSHKGTAFTPQPAKIEAEKTVAWCTCKQTSNPPFCDGAHTKC